jgi:hypothetical protein
LRVQVPLLAPKFLNFVILVLAIYVTKKAMNRKTTSYIYILEVMEMINSNKQEIAKLYDNIHSISYYKKICFSLTPKEKYEIIGQLEGKCCDNCNNGCCTVPTREKIGLGEDGLPQGNNCIGWENDYIVGKSKILGRKNIY